VVDLIPELVAVREAMQALANRIEDEPGLIDNAMVAWESVSFGDDGEPQRVIRYAVPTDNFSLSSALGLLEAAKVYVRRDLFGDDE
jgi:hypothetical protein